METSTHDRTQASTHDRTQDGSESVVASLNYLAEATPKPVNLYL